MNNPHGGYESEELLLAAMARRGETPGVSLTDAQAHALGLPVRVNGEYAKRLRAERRLTWLERERGEKTRGK